MLNRNIKQSITALEVFTRLEDKIQIGECKINNVMAYSDNLFSDITEDINIKVELNNKMIVTTCLRADTKALYVVAYGMCPKSYIQELTDEEFEDVKKRFIKIAQKQQDDFEQWIKSPDVIFN